MATSDSVKNKLAEQRGNGDGQTERKTIRQLLEDPDQQAEVAKALPNAMKPARFTRLLLTAINSQPLLQECDAYSLLAAGMQCAALGLEPNVAGLDLCWLLPFRNNRENRWDVQFMLGYKGMVDLALRSPRVQSVTARAVHHGEKFEVDYGSDHLLHVPELDERPGDVRFYYGIAHLTGRGRVFEPVPLWTIEEHRQMSKAPDSPAWTNHRGPMSLKTCIRILWKWLPKTAEAAAAVDLDESTPQYEDWFGDGAKPIDVDARDVPDEPEMERCAECGDVDGAHQEECSQKAVTKPS